MEAHNLMRAAVDHGHSNFRDRITIQTYHKLALFRPKELMEDITGVPVMMIIPELDNISNPAEQKAAFDRMKTPKKLYMAKDKGHLSILTGKGSIEVFNVTADFIKDALEGKIV